MYSDDEYGTRGLHEFELLARDANLCIASKQKLPITTDEWYMGYSLGYVPYEEILRGLLQSETKSAWNEANAAFIRHEKPAAVWPRKLGFKNCIICSIKNRSCVFLFEIRYEVLKIVNCYWYSSTKRFVFAHLQYLISWTIIRPVYRISLWTPRETSRCHFLGLFPVKHKAIWPCSFSRGLTPRNVSFYRSSSQYF